MWTLILHKRKARSRCCMSRDKAEVWTETTGEGRLVVFAKHNIFPLCQVQKASVSDERCRQLG